MARKEDHPGLDPEELADFIDLDEAADLMGVSKSTIRRWISGGRLPGYRLGERLIRVKRSELYRAVGAVPTVSTKTGKSPRGVRHSQTRR